MSRPHIRKARQSEGEYWQISQFSFSLGRFFAFKSDCSAPSLHPNLTPRNKNARPRISSLKTDHFYKPYIILKNLFIKNLISTQNHPSQQADCIEFSTHT
jgi:hypothetical protein